MEIIRRIYIKSEADLPKEMGEYFVNIYGGDKKYYPFTNDYSFLDNTEFWLKHINWYLLIEEITDADIEEWAKNYFQKADNNEISCLIIGAKAMLNNEIKHIEK